MLNTSVCHRQPTPIALNNLVLVRQIHEDNIKAELYIALKSAGLKPELELTTPVGRLDVVVWSVLDESLICAVEVKSGLKGFGYYSRQKARYSNLPIPILVCRGMDSIHSIVSQILTFKTVTEFSKIMSLQRWKKSKRKTLSQRYSEFVDRLDQDINLK